MSPYTRISTLLIAGGKDYIKIVQGRCLAWQQRRPYLCLGSVSAPASCSCTLRDGTGDGSSGWIPTTPVGRPELSTQLLVLAPGPALDTAGVWGVN